MPSCLFLYLKLERVKDRKRERQKDRKSEDFKMSFIFRHLNPYSGEPLRPVAVPVSVPVSERGSAGDFLTLENENPLFQVFNFFILFVIVVILLLLLLLMLFLLFMLMLLF
jgi:hypothetical protein